MAQILDIDPEQLRVQLDYVMPVAENIKRQGKGLGTITAWTQAVTSLTARPSMKMVGNLEELKTALFRAVAWQGCTTSPVEQTFSTMDRHELASTSVLMSITNMCRT